MSDFEEVFLIWCDCIWSNMWPWNFNLVSWGTSIPKDELQGGVHCPPEDGPLVRACDVFWFFSTVSYMPGRSKCQAGTIFQTICICTSILCWKTCHTHKVVQNIEVDWLKSSICRCRLFIEVDTSACKLEECSEWGNLEVALNRWLWVPHELQLGSWGPHFGVYHLRGSTICLTSMYPDLIIATVTTKKLPNCYTMATLLNDLSCPRWGQDFK